MRPRKVANRLMMFSSLFNLTLRQDNNGAGERASAGPWRIKHQVGAHQVSKCLGRHGRGEVNQALRCTVSEAFNETYPDEEQNQGQVEEKYKKTKSTPLKLYCVLSILPDTSAHGQSSAFSPPQSPALPQANKSYPQDENPLIEILLALPLATATSPRPTFPPTSLLPPFPPSSLPSLLPPFSRPHRTTDTTALSHEHPPLSLHSLTRTTHRTNLLPGPRVEPLLLPLQHARGLHRARRALRDLPLRELRRPVRRRRPRRLVQPHGRMRSRHRLRSWYVFLSRSLWIHVSGSGGG